jgi:hypothetical protein
MHREEQIHRKGATEEDGKGAKSPSLDPSLFSTSDEERMRMIGVSSRLVVPFLCAFALNLFPYGAAGSGRWRRVRVSSS